jgi:hypothetical protein
VGADDEDEEEGEHKPCCHFERWFDGFVKFLVVRCGVNGDEANLRLLVDLYTTQ